MLLLSAGCSRRVSEPVIVTERHSTVTADSVAKEMLRLLISSRRETESETLNRVEKIHETTTLNERGDTLRHDTRTEISSAHLIRLEREVEILKSENDSLRKVTNRTDSVEVPVPYAVTVEVPVEREFSSWERVRLRTWWWLAGGVTAGILYIFRSPLRRLLRIVTG